MRAAPLLELVAQEREDLLAGRALVGSAVRVLDGDEAALSSFRHRDPVLLDIRGSSVFQNMSLSRNPLSFFAPSVSGSA